MFENPIKVPEMPMFGSTIFYGFSTCRKLVEPANLPLVLNVFEVSTISSQRIVLQVFYGGCLKKNWQPELQV